MDGKNIGYVHSLQSMGAVDGPGIRFCVFLQGCPLRCMYCHNPDTWLVSSSGALTTNISGQETNKSEICESGNEFDACKSNTNENGAHEFERRLGTPYTAEELVTKILRYKPYFANGGGVTVSGGEPLMQAEFVTELFTLLHENGVHTCLDTSGNFPEDIRDFSEPIKCSHEVTKATGQLYDINPIYTKYKNLLSVTDLVICDIKFTTEKEYREYTGGSLEKVRSFLDLVTDCSVTLWVRHVVVPGYTDSEEEVGKMAEIARSYPTCEKIELLPFHKLCIPKYEALGIPFRCADVPVCDKETINRLEQLLLIK